jgi:hypothetical protein
MSLMMKLRKKNKIFVILKKKHKNLIFLNLYWIIKLKNLNVKLNQELLK